MRLLLLLLPLAFGLAQTETTFEGFPSIELANSKVSLTVTRRGATMARFVLQDDPGKLNPMWEPVRMARELGQEQRRGGVGGHFVCVDGFGPVSAEEREAGLPGHGEAHSLDMKVIESARAGNVLTVTLRAELPMLRENFTRTFRLVDGEQVIYVDSELENLLGFDRPAVWAEHATLGSPFLAPEVTVVDMPAARSQTRPYPAERSQRRTLASGQDFTWPMAPAISGELVDRRAVPVNADSMDHTTNLMDPNRELAYVTALHLTEHLLFGYIFKREEYPWLQTWDNYPASRKMSRGIEFSSQPYDVPRREAISLHRMFGAPTYRWLPAKSKITSSFLLFYARAPERFRKVDDVRLEDGRIVVIDKVAGERVELPASRGL